MRQVTVDFAKYDRLNEETFYKKKGKVVNVVGLTLLKDLSLIHI